MYQILKAADIPTMQYESIQTPSCIDVDPSKQKYFAAFGGFVATFMISGSYLATGNFIPYMASYLTASELEYDASSSLCTSQIQNLYASKAAMCNWLITACTVGSAFGFIGGFGFFYGIGGAVAWTPSIVCVMGWFVEHKGIITGILMNGVTAGGICYSLIETLYINPNNIANDGLCGYALYPEVTQKVPGVFLLMAILTVVLTLVSATFTMDNPQIMANDEEMTSDDTEDDETSESFECSQHRKQYTIEEALRSTQFWMIFGNVLCNLYVGTFVFADWRVFAENYLLIQNDAFLLNLDIAAAIMNSLGRLAWGFILDYTKSYRLTMCMATSILCVLVGTLPLCSEEIMLFIWICLLWFACSATYVIYPPTICNTFGDKYCAILCSFVMISTIAATSLQSGFFSLMQSIEIHEHHRWIAYCIAASCYAALSFLIAVNFGPPQIWPKHTRK